MPQFYKDRSPTAPLIREGPGANVINYTDEMWAIGSNMAALNYLDEQSDVKEQAVAKTLARGITPDNPEFSVTLANYGKEHWQRFGKNENRQGLGANTLRLNPGFSDLGQANAVGATPNLVFQGSTAEDFIPTVPRTGSNQPPTIIPNPAPPSEDAGGGDNGDDVSGDNGFPSGGGGIVNGGSGDGSSGGGIMSGPVDLAPVTNLIGTPGAGQTGPQATLMGQTAGLATDIAGVRGVVNPIGEQVTALQSAVTPLAGNVGEIKTDVDTLGTNVGTAADKSGLYAPISNLQTGVTDMASEIGTRADGQPNLLAGQKDLTTDVGNVQTGVTNLTTNMGVPTVGGPQTLFEGQGLMQKGIGQEAVKNPDGVVITPATGLFEGQAGLMTGQTGLTRGIEGLGTQLGDSQRTLEGQIGAFQTAAEQYQRGATTQRGSIEGNQIANQQAMLNQVQGVGQPLNRQADMLATQRAQEAASFAASQAPLQSQIATLTANNANQAANNQPIGPLGPMAADPRDALIQQLLTRNASLMNNRPV
tara:strand:- start:20775 stop:22370 length:1596 start_codon:yes stop_codon:yes gene_type:complete